MSEGAADLLRHPALAETLPAESTVTAIRLEGGSLFVQLELPLRPGHRHYAPPPRGERHCLAVALLCFRSVEGLRLEILPGAGRPAADGSVEYGALARLHLDQERYRLEGPWGQLDLAASALELRLEGDAPGAQPARIAPPT